MPFTGAAPTPGTHMLMLTSPVSDLDGSFTRDVSEQERPENRVGMRITGTTGGVDDAQFADADCIPETPEVENCIYLSGAVPTELGEVTSSCGSTGASSCVPVYLSPEAMYGTSITMTATVFGVDIDTDTEVNIMRMRDAAGGPITGYLVDRSGTPTLVLDLQLYMDAPDMSIPLSDHDLHSKPIMLTLEGPMTFLSDGRISIALSNTQDVPVEVNISNLALSGSVQMIMPKGLMTLQLLSPAPRGRAL
jgi:hypothetical protein